MVKGYPLSLIKTKPDFVVNSINKKATIINGLVDNDHDVDACFRLICNNNIEWNNNKSILIDNNNVCVFNSKNTFG